MEWKELILDGFNGIYEVSEYGDIKSLGRYVDAKGGGKRFIKEKLLKRHIDYKGYLGTQLCNNKKTKSIRIHQLVAISFLGHKPNGKMDLVVDHIDDNKTNNHYSNLQIVTNIYNMNKNRILTSNHIGVSLTKNGKWRADRYHNGNNNFLGYFKNELDAAKAYQNHKTISDLANKVEVTDRISKQFKY